MASLFKQRDHLHQLLSTKATLSYWSQVRASIDGVQRRIEESIKKTVDDLVEIQMVKWALAVLFPNYGPVVTAAPGYQGAEWSSPQFANWRSPPTVPRLSILMLPKAGLLAVLVAISLLADLQGLLAAGPNSGQLTAFFAVTVFVALLGVAWALYQVPGPRRED